MSTGVRGSVKSAKIVSNGSSVRCKLGPRFNKRPISLSDLDRRVSGKFPEVDPEHLQIILGDGEVVVKIRDEDIYIPDPAVNKITRSRYNITPFDGRSRLPYTVCREMLGESEHGDVRLQVHPNFVVAFVL